MSQAVSVRTVAGVQAPEAGTYAIDPDHSVVEFVVRHLGLAKVRGRFNEFEGMIDIAEDIEQSSARVTIQAASIDTRSPDRDTHLRSGDFLDAENHPALEFRSTHVRHEGGEWLVDGELTVAGVTRPVTLDVEFEGAATDPWGNVRIGFSAGTRLNREDFGLTWNQALETGGWLVGKDVRIELSVEAIRQGS
ncbi:MAG TPA: YceI family protein [Egibacteraceae bacterium]|jgi:polyisoprenoid-binding protein YceI|nr:YceI family protein [Egibacteraceae bacterium]